MMPRTASMTVRLDWASVSAKEFSRTQPYFRWALLRLRQRERADRGVARRWVWVPATKRPELLGYVLCFAVRESGSASASIPQVSSPSRPHSPLVLAVYLGPLRPNNG